LIETQVNPIAPQALDTIAIDKYRQWLKNSGFVSNIYSTKREIVQPFNSDSRGINDL